MDNILTCFGCILAPVLLSIPIFIIYFFIIRDRTTVHKYERSSKQALEFIAEETGLSVGVAKVKIEKILKENPSLRCFPRSKDTIQTIIELINEEQNK